MWSVHDQIRAHLLENAGLHDTKPMPSLTELRVTEWSTEFETFMRNRLILGCFRYGPMRQSGQSSSSRIKSMQQRLDMYAEDGNGEHLVDVANISLVEFVKQSHPKFHWCAQDDKIHIAGD